MWTPALCTVLGIGHHGVAEAVMARSGPGEMAWAGVERAVWMLVWLKLSPQQRGLPGGGYQGLDVTFLAVSAERFCINQLAMTSLLLMQHVVLAFQNPVPAPYAEIYALAPALKAVFGKRCWLLPAQRLAPHSGCSREALHLPVPQPVLPSVLLCSLCGFRLMRLCSRQVSTAETKMLLFG